MLLIACAVLGAAYFAWHRLTEVQPDYRVAVVGRQDPSAELLADLETALEAAGTDVNGDGNVHAGETITRTEFAVPLKDTALSALAEADGRTWYLCRRITDGVDADALAAADALWEDLLQK